MIPITLSIAFAEKGVEILKGMPASLLRKASKMLTKTNHKTVATKAIFTWYSIAHTFMHYPIP